MRNMKLTAKMALLVAGLLLAFSGSAAFCLIQASRVNGQVNIVSDNLLPSVDVIGRIGGAVGDYRVLEAALLMTAPGEARAKLQAKLDAKRGEIDTLRKTYEPLISSPEEQKTYGDFSRDFDGYMGISKRLVTLADGSSAAASYGLYTGEASGSYDLLSTGLDLLSKNNAEQSAVAGREIDAMYSQSIYLSLGAFVLVLALGIGLGYSVTRSVSVPVNALNDTMRALAEGRLGIAIPFADRQEEMGQMARTLEFFRDALVKAETLRGEQAQQQQAQIERGRRMEGLIANFDQVIGRIVGAVNASSNQLQSTAQNMNQIAGDMSGRSATVAAASGEATSSVQTVAAAAEELRASISEISGRVNESTTIVHNAVAQADATNQRVSVLAQAAERVGAVVTLINEIASQTNLLALNATIEAARAGEAGKGFAVVASEVKGLASQTARATEEIAQQVKAIQDETRGSVEAIEAIARTIRRVSEISTIISSAVEEQSSATQEISRNMQQAATGTAEVSHNIDGVRQASEQTGRSAGELLAAAQHLATNGRSLRDEVEDFLAKVRAA